MTDAEQLQFCERLKAEPEIRARDDGAYG